MPASDRVGRISVDPPWDDAPAYIIGGGPSLIGFDFERLRGKGHVLAVNDAMFVAPWAEVGFSVDHNFVKRRYYDFQRIDAHVYLACTVPGENWQPDFPNITLIERLRGDGLSENPSGVCMGGNSGYGALNVAYLMGARTIYLLGFDMKFRRHGRDTRKHFHDFAPKPHMNDLKYFQGWARRFRQAVPQLDSAGVQVWNCCPDSLIDAFPKISLDAL